jgi:predicted RNA-binding Zn ribbon-like protein
MMRYHLPMADPTAFQLGGGATWLNLMATKGQSFGSRPVERLPTPERLGDWLAAVELAPAAPPGPADLVDAIALREALRGLALACTRGTPPPQHAVHELERFLAADQPPRRLRGGDRLARELPADTHGALARIARQAADHLTGPERAQLRECAEHDCRWVFADPTGRRRWCPSTACASRGRVRAHRERERATARR